MRFRVFLLAIIASIGLEAQKINMDSMYVSWEGLPKDSVRNQVLNLSTDCFNTDNVSVLNTILEQSKKHFKARHDETFFIQNILRVLAWQAYTRGYFFESANMYEELLEWGYTNADTLNICLSSRLLGTIYEESLKDYDKALYYYKIDLQHSQESNLMSKIYGRLNLGTIYLYKGDYKKAKREFLIGDSIANKNIKFSARAFAHMRLAKLSELLGDTSEAISLYKQSIIFHHQIPETDPNDNSPELYASLGNLFNARQEYRQAAENCQIGYDAALRQQNLDLQKLNCNCLYRAYNRMGQDDDAYRYLKRLHEINEALDKRSSISKLQQHKFENKILQDSLVAVEKNRLLAEQSNAMVRDEKQKRNYLIIASFIMALILGVVYLRMRFIRKSRAILQVEKDRSEKLLLNILPAEVAEELKENGRADARDFEMIAILFTDFKGFTETSAKLSAQDLVSEINTCFEAFDGIITKYGIEKIKTIGDAYMAAGGLPVPADNSVKNTVLAALEMQTFITQRKVKLQANNLPAFEMRAGIHVGPVVAGIVGVKKFQYDIWGDTVNTASRMESSSEVGKVNISQATHQLLKNDADFVFESRGKIAAKGKGEMEMYFVELLS